MMHSDERSIMTANDSLQASKPAMPYHWFGCGAEDSHPMQFPRVL